MLDDVIQQMQAKYRAQGLEQGITQGVERGIKQEKIATARNMLAKGLSIELIGDITALSEAEIQGVAVTLLPEVGRMLDDVIQQMQAKYRAQGREQGIEQGVERGIEQEKIATARNMLAKGLSIELICDITGLSEAEIQALR